jgi:predicted ATPase
VAIKVLSKTGLGTEGRGKLISEAQTAAKLNHPNIVTVYDVGEADSSTISEHVVPFIVMEYVEGKSLHEDHLETIDDILKIMRQLCAGLAHAHEEGIIHRDLKPENVVITRDGTAKLMDFGLARSVASRYTTEGMVVGTVFYMAPEQALGQEIDQRADLYSLGVMLYELTTGELPFVDQDPIAVISQHLHAPVVPPRAKNDEVSPLLEALIISLLSKDREDRPTSAADVLLTLESPDILDVDAGASEELSVLDRIVRGRIVGREHELMQARRVWQKTKGGTGQTLLISGEPGIGKTRLMREVATQAEVSGGQVFVGECQAEGNAPYAPFAQITRRALGANAGNGLELPKPVMADLLLLAPELRIDYPEVESNPKLEPEAEQRRLYENVVRFCTILCQQAPLLVVLEDMHWADSGSLHLLEYLARRTRQQPIMLLGTYREVELDEALPFHETLLMLTRRRLGKRVKLERLNRNATRGLLGVIFAKEISQEFLEGIYRETEGNPFFIEEVCKALLESGEVWYEDGEWQRPQNMEDITIPQGVKVAIQSRVNKLSEETQGALLTAAVIGREFDYEILKMVTEKSDDALIDCLEEAIKGQLIEELKAEGGERFSFSHALIPAALRESVSGLRRTRLHRQVAAAIEELHPADYERLAHHWGEAGDEGRGLEYTIKAAEVARQIYANEDAVRLYSEALILIPENDPSRFELLAGRAAAYDVMADREAQLADIEEMLILTEEAGDDVQRVEALLLLTSAYLDSEEMKAREPAERALTAARKLADTGMEGRALYYLGIFSYNVAELEKAREHFEESAHRLEQAGRIREMAESLSYLSLVLGYLGDTSAGLETAHKALKLSMAEGDKLLEATTTRRIAIAYMAQYQYDEALPSAEAALQMFREVGYLVGELHALNVLGLIKRELGMFEESEQDLLEALNIAESIGSDIGVRYSCYSIEFLYNWYLGEFEKSRIVIEDQLEKALEGGDEFLSIYLKGSIAWQNFYVGMYEEALNLSEAIFPAYEKLMDEGIQADLLSFMGLNCAEMGNFELAHQYLDAAVERSSGIDDPLALGFVRINFAKVYALESERHLLLEGIERADQEVLLYRERNSKESLGGALCTKARLHLAMLEEDAAQAKEALACTEEALKLFEIAPHYSYFPEGNLFLHSRALRANGREEEADEYLRQAYARVMMVAGKFSNKDFRQSYLENIHDNRAIQEEYQARFGI